eukprot:TRINITY_DN4930_c1_g3_i2.p1 TRINITY_DN4930_c1_g3~~TRINITY_DN4930_c1_g3_i2.p1  ORF type:complete len:115 (+),score=9.52 TRINITY_DN4930_c1_g3_i2:701-1045(+)
MPILFFQLCDGSMEDIKAQSQEYFSNTQVILFVIDSTSDPSSMSEACFELHKLFTLEELRDAALIVSAFTCFLFLFSCIFHRYIALLFFLLSFKVQISFRIIFSLLIKANPSTK